MSKGGLSPAEYFKQQVKEDMEKFFDLGKWNEHIYGEYKNLLDELKYVHSLKDHTELKGKALEAIVSFIINNSFFLKSKNNIPTSVHEIDHFVTLSEYGELALLRLDIPISMLPVPKYFICECKNYNKKVGTTWVGKLYSLLVVSDKCELGIIFSYHGLTGKENNWYDSHGLTKVIYRMNEYGRKVHILDFNIKDFETLYIDRDISFLQLIKLKKESLITGSSSTDLKFNSHDNEAKFKQILEEYKSSLTK